MVVTILRMRNIIESLQSCVTSRRSHTVKNVQVVKFQLNVS
jgi:hypothetical protein